MSLNLGEPVEVTNPNGNGRLVGKVHAITFDAQGQELVIVEVNGKLIPPLPAHWVES